MPRLSRRRGQAIGSAVLALGVALLLVPSADARLKFGPARTLAEGVAPQVAVDAQDRATVAWLESGVGSLRIGGDGTPEQVRTLVSNASDLFLGPSVAVDGQGEATVAWERDQGDIPGDPGCFPPPFTTCVQAVRVGVDGTPGTVQTLASFDTPERDPIVVGRRSEAPQVVADSQGRTTVVWRRFEFTPAGSVSTVQSVRLGADGAAGPVQTLSGGDAGEPRIAIDPQDRATVAWVRFARRNARIEAVRLGADGAPGAVRTVSKRRHNADSPHVAVDPRGRATVVWRRADRAKRAIQVARVGAGGKPGKVRTLAKGSDSPRVAVDRRGRATVVWRRIKMRKRELVVRVQSVRLGAGDASRAVKTLSGTRAFNPRVAVDSRGRATVVWERVRLRGKRGVGRIEARRLRARGRPEPVQTLAKGEGAGSPQVAVDSRDRPTVVWDISDLSFGGLIQSARGEER